MIAADNSFSAKPPSNPTWFHIYAELGVRSRTSDAPRAREQGAI
ncbi:hypothetical protein [Nocardia sp. NBC_00403]